jgi:cytochrome c5
MRQWCWLAVLALVSAGAACTEQPKADASNPEQDAIGKRVYDAHCALCHAPNLEGQPNWRERLSSGRLPAPPHGASGRTWHH